MRMDRFLKNLAPILALAAAGGLAGCNMNFGDSDGVPLAELDLTGDPPEAVAQLGPDLVTITDGAVFRIAVEGDSEVADRLRFTLKDGTLGVMREPGNWDSNSTAMVRITMPAPRKLVLAGSGRMTSDRLAGDGEIAIMGSGTLETPQVDTSSLEVAIAGSGTYVAAGRTEKLELSVAGSGAAKMDGLRVGTAEISIAGSGDAAFASDGEVEANIMGSGNVTVRGSARCKVNAMGSGSLTCEREAQTAE